MTALDEIPANCSESPDGLTHVLTPFPLTPEQEAGPRQDWPWLPGWIAQRCGPDEWQIVVQAPGLGRLDNGDTAPPGTPDDECMFPVCYRDSSEIRPAGGPC